jgi:hypothetical protein
MLKQAHHKWEQEVSWTVIVAFSSITFPGKTFKPFTAVYDIDYFIYLGNLLITTQSWWHKPFVAEARLNVT